HTSSTAAARAHDRLTLAGYGPTRAMPLTSGVAAGGGCCARQAAGARSSPCLRGMSGLWFDLGGNGPRGGPQTAKVKRSWTWAPERGHLFRVLHRAARADPAS